MSYRQALQQFETMDLEEMRPSDFLQTILERQKRNSEAVTSKHGWKKRSHCPICNSQSSRFQFKKFDISLVQCTECQTAYFNQIPNEPDDVYSSASATQDAKHAYLTNKDYRKVRFATERVTLLEQYTGKSIEQLQVLDVGCGTGWFLEYAQEAGATCYGVELGSGLAKLTAEHLGIQVWNCDLLDVQTEQRFDVITMFDLIEHVVDPVALIKKAKELLTEDGVILLFTPQYDSVAIQQMKEYSNLIMPAEHLSYFTKDTVYKLAQLTNMDVAYYVTKGIDIGDLKGWADYQGNLTRATELVQLYDVLQPTIDQAEAGNHMRFVLKNV